MAMPDGRPQRPREPLAAKRRPDRGPLLVALGALLALIAGVLIYLAMRPKPQPVAVQPTAPPPAPVVEAKPEPPPPVAPPVPEVKIAPPQPPPPAPSPPPPEKKPEPPPPPKPAPRPAPPVEAPTGATVGMKSGGRHGEFSKKVAVGPHMKLSAATYFGSPGYEELVEVGSLPDGAIVAFGNAAGPQFPPGPAPAVLGSGRHTGQPAMTTDNRGREHLNPNNPDLAGLIAFFDEELSALKQVVRFDWGVASIRAGMVTGDGQALVVAGRCGPQFGSFARQAGKVQRLPYQAPDPAAGGKRSRPAADPSAPADVYVARFSASGRPEWVWVLEKLNTPPEDFFTDKAGAIYFDVRGLRKLTSDGRELKLLSSRSQDGPRRWLGVDPEDGSAYYGGDRNLPTGREPYRNPFLDKVGPDGKTVWTLWNFPSREIGGNDCRLVSDSSPRSVVFAPDGTMFVGGWSDGGNSVFPRQPTDWRKPAKGMGMGMSTWGMRGANSLCHIMRIDPRKKETEAHMWWTGYLPTWFAEEKARGAPNGLSVRTMKVLASNALAIAGGAGTGLVQTPGCFWQDPVTGDKYGGEYVAVFRPDLTNLLFSSYLPGCSAASLSGCRKGLVIASTSNGKDGTQDRPTATPVLNAIQKEFQGGTDGHILLLAMPPM